MIEEPAKPNGKQEVAEQSVIDAGQQKRTRIAIGEGKQQSTDRAQDHCQPVAKNHVRETEGTSAGNEHGPARTE